MNNNGEGILTRIGNVTGLNTASVLVQIDRYGEMCHVCKQMAYDCFKYLFEQLSYLWASDNAVNFYNSFSSEISTLIHGISDNIDITCQNAARAFNIMAAANGYPTITKIYYEVGMGNSSVVDYSVTELKSDNYGVTGMNVNMVTTVLMPEFTRKINELYLMIDNIPTTIDLYDEDDAQANAFAVNVGNIKTQLKSTVEGITTAINTYIESEVDSILLAKQQSTDAINNMNA